MKCDGQCARVSRPASSHTWVNWFFSVHSLPVQTLQSALGSNLRHGFSNPYSFSAFSRTSTLSLYFPFFKLSIHMLCRSKGGTGNSWQCHRSGGSFCQDSTGLFSIRPRCHKCQSRYSGATTRGWDTIRYRKEGEDTHRRPSRRQAQGISRLCTKDYGNPQCLI